MPKIFHDSETPANGQQVISVCAFIHHDFKGVVKVFLPKRAATKKFLPGLYELPGGHVDYGEDIVDGLRREITEEFGMTIQAGDPFAAFTYKNTIKGSNSIQVIYFATFIEPIKQVTIQPEDHSTYGWFSKDEVMARKAEMISAEHAVHKKSGGDAEYQAVLKGFAILGGQSPKFGAP